MSKAEALAEAKRRWGKGAFVATRTGERRAAYRKAVGMQDETGYTFVYGHGARWALAFEAADRYLEAGQKEMEAAIAAGSYKPEVTP